MKTVFFSLPLAEALSRAEASERSARRWSTTTLAVAILLWVWARAPSFDLVPALASIFFRIATFLSYGLLPPVGSFVSSAAQYFNLGYAIIFGPAVLLFLAWMWVVREVQALALQCWIAQHPSLHQPVSRLRLRRQIGSKRVRRILGPAFKGLVLVAASVTLLLRYTDLRSSPQPGGMDLAEYCSKLKLQGCTCNDVWVDPWRDADARTSWWWPPTAWCVSAGSGQLRNFKSVLPANFLEQQQKSKADAPFNRSQAEALAALLGFDIKASSFDPVAPRRPFETFPHIYPAVTMWLNTIVTAIIAGLWIRLLLLIIPACVGREDLTVRYWLRVVRRRRSRKKFEKIGNLTAATDADVSTSSCTPTDAQRK